MQPSLKWKEGHCYYKAELILGSFFMGPRLFVWKIDNIIFHPKKKLFPVSLKISDCVNMVFAHFFVRLW